MCEEMAPKEAMQEVQIAALQVRLEVLHAAGLLSDEELFSVDHRGLRGAHVADGRRHMRGGAHQRGGREADQVGRLVGPHCSGRRLCAPSAAQARVSECTRKFICSLGPCRPASAYFTRTLKIFTLDYVDDTSSGPPGTSPPFLLSFSYKTARTKES